ncbi:TRAP transporter small permease [Phaeovulum sp. NW3]|uniref:TRAP transporter small permease n=1 Tax=Phaeovulum sp. NW3 TaxID=2934933 RepID=UPI00201FF85E|nr:TRAP transporter small permease [Phaeovulum sp. NW3]MCL7466651.1 TRAP transporter small permease [Phaeovulum sp. NW3]
MLALNALRFAERSFIVVAFLLMVFLYFGSVITREIGGDVATSFAWVEEAVRVLNLFMVFFGLGLALERGRHVGIRNLRAKLPPKVCQGLLRVTDLIGLLFSGYIAWIGIEMVTFVLNSGQRSPTLGIPMGYIYLAPTVGFVLLALRYGLSLVGLIDRFSGEETAE